MKNNYFKLFASCIPVKGAKRSTLCDLQREDYRLIPNGLYHILTEYLSKPYQELLSCFDEAEHEIIDEYFEFLIDNEFGFWCSKEELGLFPLLDLTYDDPSPITNAIIDIGIESAHHFKIIFDQLEKLGCNDVQLRFFGQSSIKELSTILELLRTSRIRSVELIVANSNELTFELLEDLRVAHNRLKTIIVHSASTYDIKDYIVFVTDPIVSESHCGFVHQAYFSTAQTMFIESQKHNTCLNRKISVDQYGEIKNCPSMEKSYGNISSTSLAEAFENTGFKDLWNTSKDQIDICKDCEFRHICSDCRVYTANPENIYSKPAKCSYDPYTASWRR